MSYESELDYPAIVTHIWPVALARVDAFSKKIARSRSVIARQAINSYQHRIRDTLPNETEIGVLYGVELPYEGMAKLPTLSFRPYTDQRVYLEKIAYSFDSNLRRRNSVSEVIRRIIAFEVIQF